MTEPLERSDQELKSDRQYYSRKFAETAFRSAWVEIIVVLGLMAFAPDTVTTKITSIQEFLIWGLVGFFGITGAYVGFSVAMGKKK